MSCEFWIGLRYLFSRRRERFISIIGLISILGIAVGVAALIVVLAVMSGFDNDLRDKIVGTNSHIVVEKEGGIDNYEELIQRLDSMPDIVASAPFINGQALIREDNNVLGVIFRGIYPARERHVTLLGRYLKEGSFPSEKREALIGTELAWRMNLVVGDTISLISAAHPVPEDFTVCGIFKTGMFDYDMNLVFTDLSSAQEFYGVGDKAGGIGVRIKDAYKADEIRDKIQKRLGFEYIVRSWSDLNRNLFSALKLEKVTMFIILALIVMVACFNISSTLIMMVMEKTRDIGILKAIGASSTGIARIFMFNGFVTGAIGTAIGAAWGFLICYLLKTYQFVKLPRDIYYIDRLPVDLQLSDSMMIIISAVMLTLFSTIYPAWQAARMSPVDAIRYE